MVTNLRLRSVSNCTLIFPKICVIFNPSITNSYDLDVHAGHDSSVRPSIVIVKCQDRCEQARDRVRSLVHGAVSDLCDDM